MSHLHAKEHYCDASGVLSETDSARKVDCFFGCNFTELSPKYFDEELEENLSR